MHHPQQPAFIDHDRDSWQDFMASEDDVWGNPMEEPPYGWERIEEDPFMDMVGAPPSHHDFEAASHKKKKDRHRHKDKHSSSSSSTASDTEEHDDDETTTTEHSETTQPTITSERESASSTSTSTSTTSSNSSTNEESTESSLVESPVIVSNSPSPSSSPIMTHVTEEEKAKDMPTSFVISTVYAINTLMPGSYPHIDYNEVDYRQLGQIGVFTDGGSHEFHVISFWSSFVAAFVVLLMIRVI